MPTTKIQWQHVELRGRRYRVHGDLVQVWVHRKSSKTFWATLYERPFASNTRKAVLRIAKQHQARKVQP